MSLGKRKFMLVVSDDPNISDELLDSHEQAFGLWYLNLCVRRSIKECIDMSPIRQKRS